jgi:hypothetical protein
MHPLTDQLIKSLLKKDSLADCPADEIASLAKRYPYFSTAHLLLAAKNKSLDNNDTDSLARTSLYINNNLWLHHFLNKKEEAQPAPAPLPAFEDAINDELVVANPRLEPAKTEIKKDVITISAPAEKQTTNLPPLVFEPYHTVDYFASQGIKNVVEEKPKDRFGQQLKSFTEWLKTIRQMPPQQVAAISDTGSEEKVVQLATHSIEDRNVDTEAMAEVWIKQGHPEKAAAIYQKLSLLNPSKSSYFAVLIENLKKN